MIFHARAAGDGVPAARTAGRSRCGRTRTDRLPSHRPRGCCIDGTVTRIDPKYRTPHGPYTPPPADVGAGGHAPICVSGNLVFHRQKLRNQSPAWQYRVAQTVTRTDEHVLITTDGVRRFLPVEEERLFGFPDNYTAITYRGKPATASMRHKALGNTWAVPCARWICGRIDRSIRGVSL